MPRCLARDDDLGQVTFELCHREAAEAVVGAELEHQHGDVTFDRPVQPAQPAGRRVARHPRIHHLVAKALRPQALLNQRRH